MSMPNLSPLQVSQALTVLDAVRKHDDLIAAFQQKGDAEKIPARLAASLQADARKREDGWWRLPASPVL
jgi:hypothetical protein